MLYSDEQPVLLMNERDQRTWEWLKKTIEAQKLYSVIEHLKTKRKPYISYICKALNVQPPRDVISGINRKEVAMMHLERAKAILRGEIKIV